MRGGGRKSDDMRYIAHIEDVKSLGDWCELHKKMAEYIKRNCPESFDENPDEFSNLLQTTYKATRGVEASLAREAHMLALAKAQKNKALIRSGNALYDNKLGDAEMTPKFCLTLIEEFVEEFKDALDYLRQDLAYYYSKPKRPTVPVPPPIAESVPPRIPDVDYDNYDECMKRAEELCSYHEQLVDERNQIMGYQEAIHDEPNCGGIVLAINLFSIRVMRAIEFYTLNDFVHRRLYSDKTHERHVRMINKTRKVLEMAGFDHNGFPVQYRFPLEKIM